MLRIRTIKQLVYSHFMKRTKSQFISSRNLRKFEKPDPSTAKILHALNDVARQFKEIAYVFDHSTTKMILGVYVGNGLVPKSFVRMSICAKLPEFSFRFDSRFPWSTLLPGFHRESAGGPVPDHPRCHLEQLALLFCLLLQRHATTRGELSAKKSVGQMT